MSRTSRASSVCRAPSRSAPSHQQEFRSAGDSRQTANLRLLVAQIAGERLLMPDIVIDSEPGRTNDGHNCDQRNSAPSPAPVARVFPKNPKQIRHCEDVSAVHERLGAIKKRQPHDDRDE